MIYKYFFAVTTLAAVAAVSLADETELYCEGRHNDGAGAPVIQTHLWLRITESEGRNVIELQGPVFAKNSLLAEKSPTELNAIRVSDDNLVEQQLTLNRQTLRLNYSVRTIPDVDRVFSGVCRLYSPKI
jgi:hypothetical protein